MRLGKRQRQDVLGHCGRSSHAFDLHWGFNLLGIAPETQRNEGGKKNKQLFKRKNTEPTPFLNLFLLLCDNNTYKSSDT